MCRSHKYRFCEYLLNVWRTLCLGICFSFRQTVFREQCIVLVQFCCYLVWFPLTIPLPGQFSLTILVLVTLSLTLLVRKELHPWINCQGKVVLGRIPPPPPIRVEIIRERLTEGHFVGEWNLLYGGSCSVTIELVLSLRDIKQEKKTQFRAIPDLWDV